MTYVFTLYLLLLQSLCRNNFLDNTGPYFEAVATLLCYTQPQSLLEPKAEGGTGVWAENWFTDLSRGRKGAWARHRLSRGQKQDLVPFVSKRLSKLLCPAAKAHVLFMTDSWGTGCYLLTELPFANLFTEAHRVIQISINQHMKRPTTQFSSSEIRAT